MTHDFIVKNARIVLTDRVTGPSGWVRVTNGRIAAIGENDVPAQTEVIDAGGDYIFPGLIDLQINGGGGINFNDCTNDSDIEKILDANLSTGTTTVLATLITDSIETLSDKISLLAQNSNQMLAGIHVEGPFFNPEKRGMHSADKILEPKIETAEKLVSAANNRIKIITLAPEIPGALQLIPYLVQQGIIVSMAHSNATHDEAIAGLNAGVTMATHLFNTMPSIHHRNPGMVTALLNSNVNLGIIADGVHIDPSLLQLISKIRGANFFLVSDAIAPLATDNNSFNYHGENIYVRNGVCYDDRNVMAGSVTPLFNGVINMHRKVNLPLHEAINLASLIPSQILKIDNNVGSITQGKQADFLLVGQDFKLKQVYKNGVKTETVFNLSTTDNPA